jgi:RNA polymerase-binding transcription factor DksA
MEITHIYKEKLVAELALLEKELATVGRVNPENPADWQAVPADMDTMKADENEVADTIEEFEGNTAILKQLEIRYNEVKTALERIEAGTFGTCSVCNKPIESNRLEANPAANTCKEHMN